MRKYTDYNDVPRHLRDYLIHSYELYEIERIKHQAAIDGLTERNLTEPIDAATESRQDLIDGHKLRLARYEQMIKDGRIAHIDGRFDIDWKRVYADRLEYLEDQKQSLLRLRDNAPDDTARQLCENELARVQFKLDNINTKTLTKDQKNALIERVLAGRKK